MSVDAFIIDQFLESLIPRHGIDFTSMHGDVGVSSSSWSSARGSRNRLCRCRRRGHIFVVVLGVVQMILQDVQRSIAAHGYDLSLIETNDETHYGNLEAQDGGSCQVGRR